jgi:hypothetical protein
VHHLQLAWHTDRLDLTDGTAVYGITLSATGMVRTWRTYPSATPNWSLQ